MESKVQRTLVRNNIRYGSLMDPWLVLKRVQRDQNDNEITAVAVHSLVRTLKCKVLLGISVCPLMGDLEDMTS